MQHNRVRTSIPVEICATGRVAEGMIRNASDEGMFVETRAIPVQGEVVSVRFDTPGEEPLELAGLVWWTTDDSTYRHGERGFGLRLLEDDERYTQLLSACASRPARVGLAVRGPLPRYRRA
jgi:hypothetical protein